MTLRVACIGEAMVEISLKDPVSAIVGVAGDTLNTAIYLKRAAPTLDVDYITRLGTDSFSERMLEFMASEGLGTSDIQQDPNGTPGLYAISTDEAGERSFTYWRENAAAKQLFADDNFDRLDDYDVIYLSGISIAILPAQVRSSLLAYLRAHRGKFVYDSNYRPKLWESSDIARTTNAAFWEAADIALPSIDDEMLIFNQTAGEVEDRFLNLATPGALKRGPQGPLSLGSTVDQSYAPASHVVDTTAAGDSFNAGYLASYLTGADQATALVSGHRLAAEVVQHRGAIIPANAMRTLPRQ